jgi:hypothetical protein
MTQAPIPAGWYPDPRTGVNRWWDGQQWVEPPAQPAAQPAPQAPYTMVTRSKKRTSHGLHLFLTIITAGVWGLLVWLPITIIHKLGRGEKSVTRVG